MNFPIIVKYRIIGQCVDCKCKKKKEKNKVKVKLMYAR